MNYLKLICNIICVFELTGSLMAETATSAPLERTLPTIDPLVHYRVVYDIHS